MQHVRFLLSVAPEMRVLRESFQCCVCAMLIPAVDVNEISLPAVCSFSNSGLQNRILTDLI